SQKTAATTTCRSTTGATMMSMERPSRLRGRIALRAASSMASVRPEAISDAPHRLHVAGHTGAVSDLLAQPRHVAVNAAWMGTITEFRPQFLAREALARCSGQDRHEGSLGRGQVDGVAVAAQFPSRHVVDEGAESKLRRHSVFLTGHPAEDRRDAQQQFPRLE